MNLLGIIWIEFEFIFEFSYYINRIYAINDNIIGCITSNYNAVNYIFNCH